MRFAIGDATVDIIVDDDNFVLPLSEFLPGADPKLLDESRTALDELSNLLGLRNVYSFQA